MRTHLNDKVVISPETQKVFDSGHVVGDYAKHYFDDFVEIPRDRENYQKSFDATKNLINQKTPTICEAGFKFENAICFADIVRVNADGSLEIIEVKQSSDLKKHYLDDMAFQYYVIRNCGYTISKISLMHVDTSYIRYGEIEPKKLFKIVDYTEKIIALQKDIPQKIETFLLYSEQKDEPEMPLGKHCESPYECIFLNYRSNGEGLPNTKTPEENFKKKEVQEFLSNVRYPLYFFDFETWFEEPIPPVDLTHPYQQMPYQYSLHIQKSKDDDIETLEHREFLANELSVENMRALAEQLCRDIPQDAQVMAYCASFEQGCIKELARMFPDLKEQLMTIHGNFIDLAIPFRRKYLQTLEMEGRWSIKLVLPALVPEFSYSDLEVRHGGMAIDVFKTLPNLSPEENEKARQNLLAYCKMDTFAMVKILKKLQEMM
jgi:hypothetical protein